jgi:hypothetical protein
MATFGDHMTGYFNHASDPVRTLALCNQARDWSFLEPVQEALGSSKTKQQKRDSHASNKQKCLY